ncbi:MFS transporter [Streptomyces sp. DH24]|uniref:MFS transporter n=1 Tax=Streptomyces sp. DH24 TaxID=3040123 RepID=UPI0024432A9B|nr:MFS transporter [Streptomyces sp. DH24]MDG9715128.1 MFS transporter [Streptomyces sp. DH24]
MKHTESTKWAVARVLRDRNAGLCLTGVVVSGFGTSALWLAAGVWVKDLTGSDGLAALCMLAMWAPTLAGPLLGALADRVRRRPLLIGLNLLMAALLPALLAVDAPDRVWIVFAVLFAYGTAGVVHDAAESALVATAVDTTLLGDFNGLRTTATEGMKLLAPLAGAGLYTACGGPAVALLDATTFALAAALCLGLRVREEAPAAGGGAGHGDDAGGHRESDGHHDNANDPPGRGPRRERAGHREERAGVLQGVRHLWSHALLRPLVLAGGVTMLCAGLGGALVYAVVDALGRSPAFAGVLYAAQGAGSVVVGLVSGPAMRRLGERRFGALGIGLFAVALALRAVPSDAVAVVSGAAIGAGLPAVLIAALTAVQRETPGPLLGRVTATANTLVFTPNVLGLAAGAVLVEVADHRLLLTALGAALLLTAAALRHTPAGTSPAPAGSPSDTNPA